MIGFYDSGLGGVGVMIECRKLMSESSMMYYADTAQCPLGDKTPEEIYQATKHGVDFLMSQGCSIVVLACNTATALSIRRLQSENHYHNKKVLGIIRPVSEGLLEMGVETNSIIGIMGTTATIDSQFYDEELERVGYQNIVDIPSKSLADSIENQIPILELQALLQEILTPIRSNIKTLDCVVLACTHYPMIEKEILLAFHNLGGKPDLKLFIQAPVIAQKLQLYLKNHKEIEIKDDGVMKFFATLNPRSFQQKLQQIYSINVKVQQI
jgi:glutamate racemase